MPACFSRLPTELRHYIWELTLGQFGDTPTMVPYRTTRPYILEEEEDDEWDDSMMLNADDVDEEITEEQQEQIQQLAMLLAQGRAPNGSAAAAPTTAAPGGDVNATVGGMAEGDEGGDEDEDEDGEHLEDDELDTDPGDFEPGNPYLYERVWDDTIVIPVYIAPLLLVNREARACTLSWLEKHNIQLLRNTITKAEIQSGFAPSNRLPPYTRRYDPARDYIYVDSYYWRRFCDRLQMTAEMAEDHAVGNAAGPNEDDDDEPVHDMGETVRNLALPAFILYLGIGRLGHALDSMPNIQSVAAIWGDLPDKEWASKVVYETVRRDGQPKTLVTQVLLPRWDHVRISEKLSQEELDRRNADTERIKAERLRERGGEGEGEDEDDEEEEEEGQGPIVAMCVRDPLEDKVFYERGYLGSWMSEIYQGLATSELPEHVVDEEDGSITLDIVPCNAVLRK